MRKEVLFAIIAGAVLGVIIAFGVWRANISLKKEVAQIEPTPTPSAETVKSLTIAKPENYQVVSTTPTTITGISSIDSYIAVSGEEEDLLIKSDEKGEFGKDVDLIAGLNNLQFSLVGENTSTEFLSLVYSTKLEKIDSKIDESEADPEATDAVRQKVQEKLNEVSGVSFAYTGVVTDISENTLQLKSGDLGILQVSYSDLTDFIEEPSKTIESGDVAIGDYLIAMGTRDAETSVLSALRVVVSEEVEFIPWTVVMGSVSEITKKNIKVTGSETSDLELTKSSVYPDDLEEANQVIVVSRENEVRTIFIVPSPEPSL